MAARFASSRQASALAQACAAAILARTTSVPGHLARRARETAQFSPTARNASLRRRNWRRTRYSASGRGFRACTSARNVRERTDHQRLGFAGIIGESLTPDLAIRYVRLCSTLPPGRPMLITRDGRGTGRMLAQAVASGWRQSAATRSMLASRRRRRPAFWCARCWPAAACRFRPATIRPSTTA